MLAVLLLLAFDLAMTWFALKLIREWHLPGGACDKVYSLQGTFKQGVRSIWWTISSPPFFSGGVLLGFAKQTESSPVIPVTGVALVIVCFGIIVAVEVLLLMGLPAKLTPGSDAKLAEMRRPARGVQTGDVP